MTAPVIAFFNCRSGVGTTTLVYHLAWAYADLGLRVLAVDADPHAALTVAFLDADGLGRLWGEDNPSTLFAAVEPVVGGCAHDPRPATMAIDGSDAVQLLAGDVQLIELQDTLSGAWTDCLRGDTEALRRMAAFWRVLQSAARLSDAGIVLMDLGPYPAAINRAAVFAADHVVFPVAADPHGLHALQYQGRTVRDWCVQWEDCLANIRASSPELPADAPTLQGYIVMQHAARLSRPSETRDRWLSRVAQQYHRSVVGESGAKEMRVADDPCCIGVVNDHRSLLAMAQETRKPISHLKPADGAMGALAKAVQDARRDYETLAREIAKRAGVALP